MNRDGGVWKASIDWFLREDRIAWLNEGRFANRGRHGQHVHDADANDPPVGQVVTDPKCKHLFQFRGRCKVCGLKV